jgi:hypothetical protein
MSCFKHFLCQATPFQQTALVVEGKNRSLKPPIFAGAQASPSRYRGPMPDRETVGFRTIVGLVRGSTAAKVAMALLVLLSAAEAVPSIRHTVTQPLPFGTSVVSGILLLIITVTVVEGYLARLEEAHDRLERRGTERATRKSSNRVFDELASAVMPANLVVTDAQIELLTRRDDPNLVREDVAAPIAAAAKALSRTLNAWLPLLLARDDLKEALEHAERALEQLELAAWLVSDAEAPGGPRDLDFVATSLAEHEEWFTDQRLRRLEALGAELDVRLS